MFDLNGSVEMRAREKDRGKNIFSNIERIEHRARDKPVDSFDFFLRYSFPFRLIPIPLCDIS